MIKITQNTVTHCALLSSTSTVMLHDSGMAVIQTLWSYTLNKIKKWCHSQPPIKQPPIKRGTWRFSVLENFFLQQFSNFNLKMWYSVLSTLWNVWFFFFCILDSFRHYPWSPPMFFEPYPLSSWILPMKHRSCNVQQKTPIPCCNQKRFLLLPSSLMDVTYFDYVISLKN